MIQQGGHFRWRYPSLRLSFVSKPLSDSALFPVNTTGDQVIFLAAEGEHDVRALIAYSSGRSAFQIKPIMTSLDRYSVKRKAKTPLQPPLLTLLSSACQPALSPLITSHTDSSDPKRSLITVLPDTLSRPRPAKRKWDAQPDEGEYVPVHPPKRGDLADTVIHIQGPRLGETYIQAGSSASLATGTGSSGQSDVTGSPAPVPPLGVQLPWLHFQLKRLGARSMAVEVGVLDLRGVEGVIRCSSFQVGPDAFG